MEKIRYLNSVATRTLPESYRELLLADALDRYRSRNKTGVLFVDVKQSSLYLIRIYLRGGEIYCLSYGPVKGNECLELLEFYDFKKAVFLDGIAIQVAKHDIPETGRIISFIRSTGKTVSVAAH